MSFLEREIERVSADLKGARDSQEKLLIRDPQMVEWIARLERWLAELEQTKREGEQA